MTDFIKQHHDWLVENNVVIYKRSFIYKDYTFRIEKFGSKFYCVNDQTGERHKAFPIRVLAIWWACEHTN